MAFRIILTGPYAGKTKNFSGNRFINGILRVTEDISKCEFLIKYLATFGAFMEGSEELREALARDAERGILHPELEEKKKENSNGSGSDQKDPNRDISRVRPNESSTEVSPVGTGVAGVETREPERLPDGDGEEAGRLVGADSKDLRLQKIVQALDPRNDEYWTTTGLPNLSSLEEALGDNSLSRKDVERVCPGFTREVATANHKRLDDLERELEQSE